MHKKKLAGLILPAALLGTPAIANTSRNFSSSRRQKKAKVFTIKEEKKIYNEKVLKQNPKDPFSIFGSSLKKQKSSDNIQNTLSFLKDEGLLTIEGEKESISSGENRKGDENRKGFAGNGTCTNGTNGSTSCYTSKTGTCNPSRTCTPTAINQLPTATTVTFIGTLQVGETLTGSYNFNDGDGDSESGSTFKWYRSNDSSGTGKAAISGAISKTYQLTSDDIGKYISFEVTPNDGKDAGSVVESDINPTAVTAAVDTDSTLTAGAGVDESSMIPLPSTANTLAQKVDLFDFTITDTASGDALSTDITQIVINTSGTGSFSKVKWLLNGADATDVEGIYNSGANTITFSGLSISIDTESKTYTISGYYKDPTGLTDNTTFSLTITDTTITTDGTKSTLAGSQSISNSANAKVDITAAKLIFKILPSN